MIAFVVCMSENRVIGQNNDMPWHLPEDLKHFKSLTMGHSIVMGRKTYESIGRPLPGRKNIVLTANRNFEAKGCDIVHSKADILERAKKEDKLFIIGGGKIFEQFMDEADMLYVTVIHEHFDGDVFFPEIGSEWKVVERRKGIRNAQNPYDYEFLTYVRR